MYAFVTNFEHELKKVKYYLYLYLYTIS